MKVRIRNVGIDLHQSPRSLVGANAVSTTITNHKLKFPMILPHQSELIKSEDAKIYLKSPLFQYVHVPKRKNKINEKSIKEAVTEYYKDLIKKHPELIADFYYQYYSDYPPNDK